MGINPAPKPPRRGPKPRSRIHSKGTNYGPGWPEFKKRIKRRDNETCRIPGCYHKDVDVHHITPFSIVRANEEHNCLCLCRHHHRLLGDRIEARSYLYDIIGTSIELRGGRFETRRRNHGIGEAA